MDLVFLKWSCLIYVVAQPLNMLHHGGHISVEKTVDIKILIFVCILTLTVGLNK